MRFTCPAVSLFFTSAVTWGTVGPVKVFGRDGQYWALLLAFPLGTATPVGVFWLTRKFPRNRVLRRVHPVAMWWGAILWAPYGFSYVWPAVPVAWVSWGYVRGRWIGFWAKVCFVSGCLFFCAPFSSLFTLTRLMWGACQGLGFHFLLSPLVFIGVFGKLRY